MALPSARLLPGLLLLGAAAMASAQDAEGFVKVAYSLRRQGEYQAAAVAFEQALDRLRGGSEKKALALEAAELFRVMGRLDKALFLFRRNHDVPREIEVLFEMDRTDEALTVSRLVKYPRGEAAALAKLGRVDEALRILDVPHLRRERADLLAEEGRHAEAALLYAELEDFYAQGDALWAVGDQEEAARAYEDARIQVLDRVRYETLDRVKRAKQYFEQGARTGVARERARLILAKAYADLASDYEKLGVIYERTGRQRADQLYENAAKSVERQRDTLVDERNGGCAYGRALVEQEGLAKRISELRDKAAASGG